MYTFWLILVSIVWGTTFFIIKDTVDTVNEYFIVFVRCFLAFIAIFLYQLKQNKKQLFNKKAMLYGAILGILLAITYASQTIGLKYTSTGHSAFITSSAVIFAPLFLSVFFRFKLSKIDVISVIIVFAGLFMLTYDFETIINKGDLITIITACSGALHIIYAGRFIRKADTIPLVTYQFFAASAISLLAWVFTNHQPVVINTRAAYSLLYLGLAGTLFCYFIAVWVQKYVSSVKVVIIFSLEPVFASIIGYLVLHEVLNNIEFSGTILILAGVIIHGIIKNKSLQMY